MDMVIETPYCDLRFEVGRDGERIPFYFSRPEEEAAIAAFLSGDWGSLTTDEIEKEKVRSKPMTQMKVATHVLNGRRVGHFVDLVTLGSRETLKEFKVDTTLWSFVIEGSTGTFQIEVVTTGEKLGEIILGENVKLNGKELTLDADDTVSWAIPETGDSGTVGASFITSDATRITIARDGLQELFDAANDGKTVVFTVKIGNKKAVKSATMKYVG